MRWSSEHGRALEGLLEAVGLGEHALDDPFALIPVRNAVELLRMLARAEGPDIACRIACAVDLREIGALGEIARARATPRQALHAVAVGMIGHSTHERFTVENTPEGVRISDNWSVRFDEEALHVVQQYVAALVFALCAATGAAAPLLTLTKMTPHPSAGLDHVRPWLGRVEATDAPRLLVDICSRVADGRLVPLEPDGFIAPPDWKPLRDHSDFAKSVRWTIKAMMGPGAVSVSGVAAAAGMTARSLQRRLAKEGRSFSMLLDDARRDTAIALLTGGVLPLAEIAARLGYANASALTRAVRRWTGETPQAMRDNAPAPVCSQNVAATRGGAQR